ncbi:MAG: hypothetical protein A3J68_02315 [Candidatus Wildermuthbacteria bacterium RIFCSPHIGHO2_02_FULL_48_16]|uniref:Uncharacterized protein n=1 Tax=Candidatus Wildermuthbacteria bacterium RIFCSPHIGHO2_02_FULL_48_16 TaxID=1802453 RepID=A0A1G2R8Y0_9BACT|nr:MAG: hypothetical protein A3J68_02315 [Candidatus Wildermuthbacteria bacterium RIFCSPHIGHO2_02_FULL_48_16]
MLEIIPKTQVQPFLLRSLVLYLGVFFLAFSLIGFFVLQMLASNAQESIAEAEDVLRAGKTSQERKLENTVLGYRNKIQDFSSFVAGQKDAVPFFVFVEEVTHPQVFFREASLTVFENRMVLKGVTTDFRSLGEQAASLEGREELVSWKLSEVSLSKGQVVFTLELLFSSKLFQ